jgi:hypothetical protein
MCVDKLHTTISQCGATWDELMEMVVFAEEDREATERAKGGR